MKQAGMMEIPIAALTIRTTKAHEMGNISKRFCCILITFLFYTDTAQAQGSKSCSIKNTTTSSGETISYKVYYTLAGIYVPAGEATFSNKLEIFNKQKVFHVTGEGHTYRSYDWFYKVRDVYESFIDTLSMLPMKFQRNISEGGAKSFEQTLFNHKENKAVSAKTTINIPDCTQDVLSMIYYARNIDFSKYKVNDKIPFEMYLDDQVHSLYLRYLGKAVLKTKYGTFNTIKFKPKLIEGTLFRGGEEMTVFVTDDKNKIPVYIETPIVVGKVKVYLVRKSKSKEAAAH